MATPTLDGPVLAALAATDGPFTTGQLTRVLGEGSEAGIRKVLRRLTGRRPDGHYAAAMAPELKPFLTAWFLTILGWVGLLGAGFAVNLLVTDRVDNELLRWVVNALTLFGSIKLGLVLYHWVFSRADPRGRLRAEAAKLGADAEDETVPERYRQRRERP